MIIGSTSLPTAVPLVDESKDDQLEIDQPSNTDKEMEDPSPSVKEQMTTDENITDNATTEETTKASATDEQMDTDQTNGRVKSFFFDTNEIDFDVDLESPSMVIDEKQSENTNDMEEEVTPSRDTKVTTIDQSKTEVTSTAMVQSALNSQFHFFSYLFFST